MDTSFIPMGKLIADTHTTQIRISRNLTLSKYTVTIQIKDSYLKNITFAGKQLFHMYRVS